MYVPLPPGPDRIIGEEWANQNPFWRRSQRNVFDTDPCPIDNAPNHICTGSEH